MSSFLNVEPSDLLLSRHLLRNLPVQNEADVLDAVTRHANGVKDVYPKVGTAIRKGPPLTIVNPLDPLYQTYPTTKDLSVPQVATWVLAGVLPIGLIKPFSDIRYDEEVAVFSTDLMQFNLGTSLLSEPILRAVAPMAGAAIFPQHDMDHNNFLVKAAEQALDPKGQFLEGLHRLAMNGHILKSLAISAKPDADISDRLKWAYVFELSHERSQPFIDNWTRLSQNYDLQWRRRLGTKFGIAAILKPHERLAVRLGLLDAILTDLPTELFQAIDEVKVRHKAPNMDLTEVS